MLIGDTVYRIYTFLQEEIPDSERENVDMIPKQQHISSIAVLSHLQCTTVDGTGHFSEGRISPLEPWELKGLRMMMIGQKKRKEK